MNTDTNMINDDEAGWTKVKPKYKSKNQTNNIPIIKPTRLEKRLRREQDDKNIIPLGLEEYKVKKNIPTHFRPLEKQDYTLTPEEKDILNNNDLFCYCCQSDYISSMIKRPFTCCHICYCCAGDDAYYASKNLCIFVDETLTTFIILNDKMCPIKYK